MSNSQFLATPQLNTGYKETSLFTLEILQTKILETGRPPAKKEF